MARVTFTNGTASITSEARVEATWRLPVTGNAGEAVITLAWGNPALSADYIDTDTGSHVLVHDEGGSGDWSGHARQLSYADKGVVLTCRAISQVLGRRHVMRGGRAENVPAGLVASIALQEAGLVAGLHAPNAPFGGGATVRAFDWTRQDVWAVLNGLMSRSDGELFYAHTTSELRWEGALAHGALYPEPLIAGGSFRNWSLETLGDDRVAEVIATADGEIPYVARGSNGDPSWPAQALVTAESGATLRATAEAELAQRASAVDVVKGVVTREHWAIREGDVVQVYLPRARLRGLWATCRVLERSLRSDLAGLMSLTLLVIPDAADAIRLRPPGARGSARGRGTGSVVQRLLWADRG